ncbi:MAG: hypothetical protein Q4E07_06915 [Eubacteriales bacterium]|nr:hypothetical protein [Eubacteriales bacterium]
MSAFLGPIHFWLYNKIGKQEELTKAIASHAISKGWIDDKSPYIKDLPALESVIDESNIHGWLQNNIHDAEGRYARLIFAITNGNDERMEDILQIATEYGKQNSVESDASPKEIYRTFEDFFVNGMPCDRVNALGEESKDELSWYMTQDIHAQYWVDGASPYYAIRRSVMDGMLFNTPYQLFSPDDAHYTIKKK